MRYYWYPSHLYTWRGYQPVARQIYGDTNNYYTYNYYDTSTAQLTDTYTADNFTTHETYADVRENLENQQDTTPENQQIADTYFEAGMKAFENAEYAKAAQRFEEAIKLAPEDIILPYAFSQALFADGRFEHAVQVLRTVINNLQPDQEGIYYPRGLYLDEKLLFKQIDQLADQTQRSPSNPDLQLLLGYHLLGIGEIDTSIEQFAKASQYPQNTEAATVLLRFAVELKTANDEANNN